MKILSVDAAGKALSLAVAEEGRLLALAGLNVGLTHSQRLLPLLQAMLANADLALRDMDMLAVTNGPGSFTGLRIGLATAKGLAQTLGLPLLPVSTLAAQAYSGRGQGAYICPMLDARRNEVYTSLYTPEGAELWPPLAVSPAELAGRLQAFLAGDAHDSVDNSVENPVKAVDKPVACPQPTLDKIIFVGDAAELFFADMRAALGDRAVLAPPERRLFGAVGCAFVALERPELALPPAEVRAFYLRLSEAERNRLAKLAGEGA